MQPDYTQHARERMAERHITEAEVERTLSHYFRSSTSRLTGNIMYIGQLGDRRITVVVARGSHPPRVVTVWD